MASIFASLRLARPAVRVALWATLAFVAVAIAVYALHLHGRLLGGVLVVLAAASFLSTLVALRFDRGTKAILLGAVVVYVAYLGYTQFGERNYDGGAQLEYVQYIVEHRAIPPPAHCFICHHPPAYYVVAAVAYAFCERTHVLAPTTGVQAVSLLVFLPFIVFAPLLARRFSSKPRHHQLATAIAAFWPYTIHNSIRLHNDTLVSSLMVVALYWTVRFHQEGRTRDLVWAGLSTAGCVLSKSNGYAMVALLAAIVALRIPRAPRFWPYIGRGVLVGALLLGAMATNAVRQVPRPNAPGESRGELCERVMGTACRIGKHQLVGNDLKNYLGFDLGGYLDEPYLLAERDTISRQYFWNDLFKTSLLGTHNTIPDRETAYDLNVTLARIMNVLLLVMVVFGTVGTVLLRSVERRRHRVLLGSIAMLIAFAMAFRILIPAPHHNDFRHIFALLVPAAVVYASATLRLERFGALGRACATVGVLVAAAQSATSVAYFWPKYEWAMRVTARTIPVTAAEMGRFVGEGTPWDRVGNRILDLNHTLEMPLARPQTIGTVDTTLDGNDRYEVRLYGATETRKIFLGPRPSKGLTRYVEKFEPPVEGVTKVTLRPISGDKAYSVGHLIVR